MYCRSSLSVITLRQFLKELCLSWNLEYRKYTVFHSFLLHALTYWAEFLHMTLFLMYYRASLSVVTLRQFLKELCFFVNLEHLFGMLSWNFAHDFVLMYYRSSSSVRHSATVCLSVRSSFFWTCLQNALDNWAEIFKFDFGFFNALFLEKCYIKKKNLLKCSWRAYYALFAVLGYIFCLLITLTFAIVFEPKENRNFVSGIPTPLMIMLPFQMTPRSMTCGLYA